MSTAGKLRPTAGVSRNNNTLAASQTVAQQYAKIGPIIFPQLDSGVCTTSAADVQCRGLLGRQGWGAGPHAKGCSGRKYRFHSQPTSDTNEDQCCPFFFRPVPMFTTLHVSLLRVANLSKDPTLNTPPPSYVEFEPDPPPYSELDDVPPPAGDPPPGCPPPAYLDQPDPPPPAYREATEGAPLLPFAVAPVRCNAQNPSDCEVNQDPAPAYTETDPAPLLPFVPEGDAYEASVPEAVPPPPAFEIPPPKYEVIGSNAAAACDAMAPPAYAEASEYPLVSVSSQPPPAYGQASECPRLLEPDAIQPPPYRTHKQFPLLGTKVLRQSGVQPLCDLK